MKNKDNPYVSLATCDLRTKAIGDRVEQVISKIDILTNLVRGNPAVPEDMGLCGDIRDIKRDRKWIYGIITVIVIPILYLLLKSNL